MRSCITWSTRLRQSRNGDPSHFGPKWFSWLSKAGFQLTLDWDMEDVRFTAGIGILSVESAALPLPRDWTAIAEVAAAITFLLWSCKECWTAFKPSLLPVPSGASYYNRWKGYEEWGWNVEEETETWDWRGKRKMKYHVLNIGSAWGSQLLTGYCW